MDYENDKELKLVYQAVSYYHQLLLNEVGYLGEEDYEEVMADIEVLEKIIEDMENK